MNSISSSQVLINWYQSQVCPVNTSSTMAETRATAILNETIASLKSTTDHHNKDIQEIHKITSIYTRTLNEMSQQSATILQKLNASENVDHNLENPYRPEDRNCHQSVSRFSRPVKLDFPRFSGEEPTSWIYKANQYSDITRFQNRRS